MIRIVGYMSNEIVVLLDVTNLTFLILEADFPLMDIYSLKGLNSNIVVNFIINGYNMISNFFGILIISRVINCFAAFI